MPRYMAWLREAAGQEYRSFGIYPDYSSIGEIQDVEVVGPLATNEWVTFVDLVSGPTIARFHRNGSTFALVNKIDPTFYYDLRRDYLRTRPLFDWMGVRYLVLEKAVFNGRVRDDHETLLERTSGLRTAYQDDQVLILESPAAQSKAFFTTRVRAESASTTVERLQADPGSIAGPVTVEPALGLAVGDAGGQDVPVPLAEYRPNDLRATFEASGPGIFVVKDSYFPGWQATVNGRPAEVIRVNGLVRGVVVPAAGPYEVTMSYRPPSFRYGVWIAAVAGVVLAALLAWDRRAAKEVPRSSGGERRLAGRRRKRRRRFRPVSEGLAVRQQATEPGRQRDAEADVHGHADRDRRFEDRVRQRVADHRRDHAAEQEGEPGRERRPGRSVRLQRQQRDERHQDEEHERRPEIGALCLLVHLSRGVDVLAPDLGLCFRLIAAERRPPSTAGARVARTARPGSRRGRPACSTAAPPRTRGGTSSSGRPASPAPAGRTARTSDPESAPGPRR